MAVRLSKAFGRSPESWLALQSLSDLAQVAKDVTIDVKPLFEKPMSI
jgi:plasmid maintenance system antidote protein VapI